MDIIKRLKNLENRVKEQEIQDDGFMKALGFMTDGTINYIFPTLTLVLIICIRLKS